MGHNSICVYDIHLSPHNLLIRLPFLHWIAFAPFSKSVVYICEGLFLDSLFFPIYLSPLIPITHCLDYSRFQSLKIWKCPSSNLTLFQSCFSWSRSSAFPYKLQIGLPISLKIFARIFIGFIEYMDLYLGRCNIEIIRNCPTHEDTCLTIYLGLL